MDKTNHNLPETEHVSGKGMQLKSRVKIVNGVLNHVEKKKNDGQAQCNLPNFDVADVLRQYNQGTVPLDGDEMFNQSRALVLNAQTSSKRPAPYNDYSKHTFNHINQTSIKEF